MSDVFGPAAAAAAVVAFAATNIDDILVLIVFFARVAAQRKDPKGPLSSNEVSASGGLRNRQVIVGQVLGFSVLVAISLIGIGIGIAVPTQYIGLIGFIPILLGLYGCWQLISDCRSSGDEEDKPTEVVANPAAGAVAEARPAEGAAKEEGSTTAAEPDSASDDDDDDEDPQDNWLVKLLSRLFGCCTPACCRAGGSGAWLLPSAFTLEVATMTIANGADNISIYIPLFAATRPVGVAATIAIFYALVGVWCLAAYGMIQLKPVAKILSKYGDYIVPLLLIALGIYILHGSVAFPGPE